MRAKPKMGYAIGGDACLVNLSRSQLQSRADTERVVLAASVAQALELDVHRQIAVSKVIAQQSGCAAAVDQEKILVSVFVDIRNRERRSSGGTDRSGKHIRAI